MFVKVWSKIAPIRASVVARRLLWDRLPIRINLHNMHILPQNSTTDCPLCKQNFETTAHPFFDCSKSMGLWKSCFKWLDIQVALQSKSHDHFMVMSGMLPRNKGSKIAIGLWICVIWLIWKGRNELLFEDKSFDEAKMIEQIKGQF